MVSKLDHLASFSKWIKLLFNLFEPQEKIPGRFPMSVLMDRCFKNIHLSNRKIEKWLNLPYLPLIVIFEAVRCWIIESGWIFFVTSEIINFINWLHSPVISTLFFSLAIFEVTFEVTKITLYLNEKNYIQGILYNYHSLLFKRLQ